MSFLSGVKIKKTDISECRWSVYLGSKLNGPHGMDPKSI